MTSSILSTQDRWQRTEPSVPKKRVLLNHRHDETRRSPAAEDPAADLCRRLGAVVESAGQVVVLRARGEVDAYTLPRWRNLLDSAAAETAVGGHLVVDLGQVMFLSVRAVMALADLAQHLSRHGIATYLVAARTAPTIAHVLDLAGMTEWLSIHRDLTSALAAADHRIDPDDTTAVPESD
ncbi:anti-sigma factor antagonist [Nocardia sp. NPDC058633]|uniref:anti-sigma factor antagonist n=1 Tax=Nocardia sp. NPDC058633 TaxID=3346568 RepID=UPI00365D517D